MSTFTINQYQAAQAAAQNRQNGVKVGFFKLQNDLDEALVRFDLASVEELEFVTVHSIHAGDRWLRVSCLNEFGSYGDDNCPLCRAANANDQRIGKVAKKVFVKMLVSYKDSKTGQWGQPQPVVWERSATQKAGFVSQLSTLYRDYGDLRNSLFKVTRNGAKSDINTTYSITYAVPTVYKPEMIPADFSALDGLKLNKHSYWEKTAEEMNTFIETGEFPEVVKTTPVETVEKEVVESLKNQAPIRTEAPVASTVTNTPAPAVAPAPTATPVEPAPVKSNNFDWNNF